MNLPRAIRAGLLCLGLCPFALLAPSASGAQPFQPVASDPVLESWRWRLFPELSGLGLQCMAEAKDGTMWFGTSEGVSHYDGFEWRAYTPQDGLGGAVDNLCPGKDGSMYASGPWGISRFSQGQWRQVFPAPGQRFGTVKRIVVGQDGTLWAATAWGAIRFQESGLVLYTGHEGAAIMQTNPLASSLSVELLPESLLSRPRSSDFPTNRSDFFEVYEDRQGRLWFGTEDGEVLAFTRPATPFAGTPEAQLGEKPWVLFNEADGLVLNRRPRILQTADGVVWVVNYGSLGRANQFDGTSWKNIRLADFGASDDCSCLLQTRDGVLWIGCNGSVCANRGGHWQVYQPPSVPIPTVRTLLLQTSDGALWIAGQDANVLRLDYQTRRWLSYQDLNFQWESRQGAQWFLHRDGRVVVHDGNHWTSYGTNDGLLDAPTTLLGARDGDIWVAGSHEHIAATARFDGHSWTRFIHDDLSWAVDWRAAFESSDGSLWFGAAVDSSKLGRKYLDGVMQYHDGQWTHHRVTAPAASAGKKLPFTARDANNKFYGLGEARDGTIWGGQLVISVFDGKSWQISQDTPERRIGTVEAIFTSADRELWIGSRQFGLFHYDGRSWLRYHVKDGLVANTIRSITQTTDGTIWVATDGGVSRFDGRNWTSDVLPAQLNMAREGGSLKGSPSGALWINRSSRNWNRRAWPKSAPFDTSTGEFWSVSYQLEHQTPRTAITLGPQKVSQPGNLTISWKATDPWRETPDAQLQYSFRLDGGPWSAYSRQVTCSFFSLLSGQHHFEVRARNHDFNVDPHPATLDFVVIPPVWRQGWFLSLMFLLTGAIAAQTIRAIRSGRRLRQSNVALAAEVEERKRIEVEMEKTHKQLVLASHQAGMAEVATNVLHNVGNVLNSVNVSADWVAERIQKSKISELPKVAGLLAAHAQEPGFLAAHEKGKLLPDYLKQLSSHLAAEREGALKELGSLQQNINHVKDIIAMQQEYSRLSGFTESVRLTDLVEDALRLNEGALARHQVQLVRDFQETGNVVVEKHKVLQILVNLIRNAKYACDESQKEQRRLTVRTRRCGDEQVQIEVADNGVGIPAENLTRIFAQGFTTRRQGHGFGLHSAANAARELGGTLTAHSQGPGHGASFTLEIPVDKTRPTVHQN